MKISAISVTTFTGKSQIAKKTTAGLMSAVGAGLAADTFVKGLSKPDKDIEENIIRGNDEGANPCDECCDELFNVPENQRERSNCDCNCD